MLWRIIVRLLGAAVLAGCAPANPAPQAAPIVLPRAASAVAAPATSPLAVTAVVPEPNASAVLFDSAVFVQFNHPVVPLTTLDQPGGAAPLQIDPPIDGTGRWINTGLYTFTPTVGWAPSSTYHLSVPSTAYAWSFATLPAGVAATHPAPNERMVDPGAAIRITFNQPVDLAGVHVTLEPSAVGTAEWADQRTLLFHPDVALAPATDYAAQVRIDGATKAYSWRFSTAPPPNLVRTVPPEASEAPQLNQVELFFSAPMDRDDVRANLAVEPPLDYSPFPNWRDDDTHVVLYASFKPATSYTLSLPAGVRDRFGRPLADGLQLHFTTPAGQVSSNAPPVPPQAWLISPGPIGTYDAYEHPRAVLRTTNVSHFDYALDAVDERVVVGLYSGPIPQRVPEGRRVASGSRDLRPERNVPSLTSIDLGQLAPGYYRLHVEPTQTTARVQDHLVVVTRTLLAVKESTDQMLVWATDLHTGQPLANLRVRVLRPGASDPVAVGTTAADGTLQVAMPPVSADAPSIQKTNRTPAGFSSPTLVIADRAGDATLALSSWSGGLGPWTFGLPTSFGSPAVTAHVYSDRPIYRPGQTVHLKGIVRADDDAQYSVPTRFAATWQVVDSQGRAIRSGTIDQLSDFGTFANDVELSTESATGNYSFAVKMADRFITSAPFLVADYQPPAFEVNLDKLGEAVAGQSLDTSLRAAYYFGQPLANSAVHWQVSAEPFAFQWHDDQAFRFGDADQPALRTQVRPVNAPRAEGAGKTRSDGSFAFQVPTDLGQDVASQRFTIEATVTDPDHGEVSNRQSVVVHKAGLYLGLKPSTSVSQADRPQTVELVTLDTQGGVRADVAVHGQILRRRWLNVRQRDAQGELHWTSRPEDTPIDTFETRSGADGRGTFTFTPSKGGAYQLIVEAPDAVGNVARTAIGVWVAGPGFIPWRVNDDGRLELQADKPAYQPGDTAHIMVPAPIADATALVTVERGKLISHAVRQLSGNSAVLDIPIGAEHVPNAFVSVVLFGGGQAPALFSGYVELSVSSQDRQLQVTAEPDRRDHGPGDLVSFTLRTRDSAGNGAPAEVSVAVVDAAVLSLTDSRADPVMAFWHRRPVGVRSGSSLGVSIDRQNESASSGLKGGGGADPATVRQDFPDTAFWQSAVRTDADGSVQIEVQLPDTLTTWRLTAVAVTRDTRLGVGTTEVVTGKAVLVRPLVPRFLVGGDVVTVGAAVHNATSAALHVSAALTANGLAVQGDARRSIDVPAGGQVRVDWPVTSSVGQSGQASLRFDAAAAGIGDAVEVQVPVLAWGASSTVATAGEVASADTTSEVVEVNRAIDHQRGELRVDVTPSLAAALRYGLRQVEEYRYECLEQTVSRFLPRLALARAIDGLGLGDPLNLKSELPGLVTRSIQRMYRFQHADGGWGWWQDDVSQPYLTAYSLFGLVEARRSGFDVDQGVVDRGTTFLRAWLNADPGPFGLDTRAYVVYVLGQAGSPEPARAAALFDRRADLGPTARGYLAQALAAVNSSDGRVGGLLAELSNQAVVSATGSHWEEANSAIKPWIMGTDVRTTAAVLDALVRLRPDHPLVTSAVRWLMAARREGGAWESTHDSAMSLLTLTDFLAASGELSPTQPQAQGGFSWQLGVNGTPRQNGSASDYASLAAPSQLVMPMADLKVGDNHVDLLRSIGAGRLYYTLQLKTFSQAEDMAAESHGFSVAREYLTPSSQVHAGDLVQVRLTVVAPNDLHDVVIEDLLPAGLEPIDTRLKTTSTALADAVQAATADAVQAAKSPGWQPWSHVDVRSDRVALFATYLGKGAYQFVYMARASLPGEYRVLPTSGHEQYFPEVNARADGRRFTVLP